MKIPNWHKLAMDKQSAKFAHSKYENKISVKFLFVFLTLRKIQLFENFEQLV